MDLLTEPKTMYVADGTKKSLNSLSQKFLMMFLVAQPQILNLDLCARVLIGDAVVDHSDLGKFKSKLKFGILDDALLSASEHFLIFDHSFV